MNECDRKIKQNAVIREIQLMENCTSCYLEERVKILLTPWVTKSIPWDQSSEFLSEVISGTKENSPCSGESTEPDSDTESQFNCHHLTSYKKPFPSPQILMSLYNRNHGYFRL